jgi:signal transduction histidine kinase
MKVFIFSLSFFLFASKAWGYVPHEYPAIYTHQLARIFLLIAFGCVLWAILYNRLHKQKGWRYLFLSVLFFIIWDLDVFVGRIAEFIKLPRTIGSTEGWEYFTRDIVVEGPIYLYYIGRLDFLLLNIAMLLFYVGLRELLKTSGEGERSSVPVTAVLPLLPILINDMIGSIVFIVLSIMSFVTSIQLYQKERENVLWNYMVWLSSSWVMFSFSRSFGHILKHILIPTGNQDIWKFLEPIGGSFNTFACFFVGSISIFFIWMYRSYLEISKDKRDLENLVVERTQFIEQLEEDKIELKELDKLKSTFLANVSHELRTPMNTIIGYTELLIDRVDGPVNEEQEKSLKKVATNAKHLLRLINDVLDISKMESGEVALEIKELDLKWLVDAVTPAFEPLIKQKGLNLTVNFDEGLPFIYGDEERIKQILINLLSNAIKFTHRGGITISAKLSERGTKHGEPPIFTEICVEDTGIGIKEGDLGRIFDKFFQVDPSSVRQYEGTGLGLSIVKGLVSLHKGMIWVTSTYGKGSRFCFTLPLRKEMLEKPAELAGELSRANRMKEY